MKIIIDNNTHGNFLLLVFCHTEICSNIYLSTAGPLYFMVKKLTFCPVFLRGPQSIP